MRADRPPTRHKDKTKTPVFVCCCAWKWRLQKPTYCEYARLRVAHVSPWKPLGVRTIASPLREYARLRVSNPIRLLEMGAVWYARLRAYMYGSHDCEHTCVWSWPCETWAKWREYARLRVPGKTPSNFWGGAGNPLNPTMRLPKN